MSAAAASWAPWGQRAADEPQVAQEQPRLPPWAPGEPLHVHEVVEVYRRAFGRDVPHHLDRRTLHLHLIQALGELRFDFEVNRLRGYAWEQAA